jgi:hypothetical protein
VKGGSVCEIEERGKAEVQWKRETEQEEKSLI